MPSRSGEPRQVIEALVPAAMKLFSLLVLVSLESAAALTTNLFVSHFSGTIYTLSLTNSSSETFNLAQNSSLKACGSLASWLTTDSASRKVYCSDETWYGSGSISAIDAATNGGLSVSAKATAAGGGVANTLYGGTNGTSFIDASFRSQTSQVSTFALPLTTSSTALQTFKFTLSKAGTVPSRQDASHPHHVVTDPTGGFLIVPDLGADLIRIFSIDKLTGKLSSCPEVAVTAGNGPRHGAFWNPTSSSTGTMLYIANELANTVTAFTVTYPDNSGCLSLTQKQVIAPYTGNATAPTGSKVAEVHTKGNFLYATNRNDKTFSPNDSIVTFSLSSAGDMSFLEATSSGGTYPRTFAINKSGDLVAIGDQTTSNVAIVVRDMTTGKLGEQVASLRIGTAGTPENEDGLSSVLWDES